MSRVEECAMTDQASTGDGQTMVTGLFRDSESVERAYEAVAELGYDKGDVNVVMSDDTRKRYFSEDREIDTELARKVSEGGELGGPRGGRISILIPILAAVGSSVALSGLGLVIAGPVAVALAGAGAAAVAAGLIGALADWGIPEERLREYEAAVHDGGILVGVKSRSAEDLRLIAQQWIAIGGQHVHA
jgi:hypothetical protein